MPDIICRHATPKSSRWPRTGGRVLVIDLAAHFAVTPQTIRKDLNNPVDQRLPGHAFTAARCFPSVSRT